MANAETATDEPRTAVQREADYRLELLDQFLGGPVRFEDRRGSFEGLREGWMAPQCAILQWLLDWLGRRRGVEAARLEPFLEIGAFTAHLSGFLAARHGLTGYCGEVEADIAQRAIDEVLPKLGMKSDGLTAVSCDASRLAFDDESLAFVFCFSTLHHFEDPGACLGEVHRVLRPGGVFLCAHEPIQPTWRRSRAPYDCSEVRAGLVENVYTVREYDALIAARFADFDSIPYDHLRAPRWLPAPDLFRTVANVPLLRPLRRFVVSKLGGQDYSAIAVKPE